MVAVSFRCRYEPQAIIFWLVNGTRFRGSPSEIESTVDSHDNGSETEILTISNNPLFNGTQVVCVAYPEGNREATPIAILTITEGELVCNKNQCIHHDCTLSHADNQTETIINSSQTMNSSKKMTFYLLGLLSCFVNSRSGFECEILLIANCEFLCKMQSKRIHNEYYT